MLKIGGVEVKRSLEVLVLPRDGGDLVIKAESVSINKDFDRLCPEADAPGIRTRDGFKKNHKDETYLKQVADRDAKHWDYMVLRSLRPSEINWEKVDLDKPSTYSMWKVELLEAGLSDVEINRVINVVSIANALDEGKLKEARESFLRGQDQ